MPMKFYSLKRYLFANLAIICLILMVVSCAPKPKVAVVTQPVAATPIPCDLKVDSGNTKATLYWRVDRMASIPIQGYNIYLANSPDGKDNLYNAIPYPGDTDGNITRESIELVGLKNAQRYYATIRTVFGNGELTDKSSTISFLPLAKDTIELSQNYLTDKSGFCFSKGVYTATRDYANDIYVYSVSGKVGLSSPSLLYSGLRKTLISREAENRFATSLVIKEGETYKLKTADNALVKIKLLSIKRLASEISVTMEYTYYPPGIE
jgi:hypothetical protein